MKTPEEIRDAVLADCERLCPNEGNSFCITPSAKLIHVVHAGDWHQWEIHCPIFNGDGYTWAAAFKVSQYPSCTEFTDFYRLLGLEARDERERAAKLIEALENSNAAIIDVDKHGDSFDKLRVAHRVNTEAIEDYKKGEQP